MDRETRRKWQAARTLPELGELVARWLEGDLPSQPGYAPNYGPDRETGDLVPTLALLNRAGFVTISSQPGCDEDGRDGARWVQHAAVTGVGDADTADWLRQVMPNAGVILLAGPVKRGIHWPWEGGNGSPYLTLRRGDLRRKYRECSAEMLDVVFGSQTICLYAQEADDNSMWEPLRLAAQERLEAA